MVKRRIETGIAGAIKAPKVVSFGKKILLRIDKGINSICR